MADFQNRLISRLFGVFSSGFLHRTTLMFLLYSFSKMGVTSLVQVQGRMVHAMFHLFALPSGDWREFFLTFSFEWI